jgi:hypothetical protein
MRNSGQGPRPFQINKLRGRANVECSPAAAERNPGASISLLIIRPRNGPAQTDRRIRKLVDGLERDVYD